MRSGRTLWDELVFHYTSGVEGARSLDARWTTLRGRVDDERHAEVARKLRKQVEDAAVWRDKCLTYFQQFSKRPITSPATPIP
jgi:alpha-glucuronidase